MDTRTPERLVRVDVPHSGDPSLVEQDRLHGGATARQRLGEPLRCERADKRLSPEALGEVPLDLVGLEQLPGAEPPHVSIDDIRSVV